ncbi:MAG: DUF1571 domain-containing protein [Planctomycetales bacterium]
MQRRTTGSFGPNCFAALILLATPVALFCSFESRPAGVHLGAVSQALPLLVISPPLTIKAPQSQADGSKTPPAASPATPAAGRQLPQGRLATLMSYGLLLDAKERLEKIPDYSATFLKQERVEGKDIQELQTIEMRLRHQPFSIYMKWLDVNEGQELLYVEGEREGNMLVKKGGRLGKMIPAVSIPPKGKLAMAESRYPVTTAGLLGLTEKLLSYRKRDLGLAEGVDTKMLPDEKIDGRLCYCFQTEYASEKVELTYRKSMIWIDQETSFPLCVKNYCWPNDETRRIAEEAETPPEDPTLIENYTFTNLRFEKRLNVTAFNETNGEYKFK